MIISNDLRFAVKYKNQINALIGALLITYSFMGVEADYSINQHSINSEVSDSYIFLVAGHSYGGQKPRNTVPAYALTNNIELLNHLRPEFMVHLGDIYQKPTVEDVESIQDFNNRLSFPVFNALGNHEYADINMYKEYFGDTYYSFVLKDSLYIVLDSQDYRAHQLDTEQHKFFLGRIGEFKASTKLKNLFILSHHLIWASANDYFKDAIQLSNAPYHYDEVFFEWRDIINGFDYFSDDKHVYFISGDVGMSSSVPYFYEEDPRGGRTYVATGLGDNSNDSILVGVVDSGKVSFHILYLGHKNINQFGMSYWKNVHPRLSGDKNN